MKFLLYSINYSPELTGIGKYNGELAQFLSSKSIDTHVLTAQPYYPEWKIHGGFTNRWNEEKTGNITIHRCPLYVPSNVTLFKRLLHLSSFALSSLVKLFGLFKLKPDFVFVVQPTLFCTPAALLYGKLTGAKCILHIQDYELDAMFGLEMGKGGGLKKVAYRIESWLLKRFDIVSSISHSMLTKASQKGVAKNRLAFFPNWTDIDFISPDKKDDQMKRRFGIAESDKIVLYSGNLGLKQGLDIILEVAQDFQNQKGVVFLIIGSGAFEEKLKAIAQKMVLTNVIFAPIQPWEEMPFLLTMADIHLVIQKKGAADAVLPSKLINILAAGGHAIVTAERHTELGLISEMVRDIYTCIEPENKHELKTAIAKMLQKNTLLPNTIAREYALANFQQEAIINSFIEKCAL